MLPILLPPIVIGSIWRLMYGFDFGLFNYLLSYLGVMPIDWLGDPEIAFFHCYSGYLALTHSQ